MEPVSIGIGVLILLFQVFVTIPALPGNHGLNGVFTKFSSSGTSTVQLQPERGNTDGEGKIQLQVGVLADGDAELTAEVTIAGVTRKVKTPKFEATRQ